MQNPNSKKKKLNDFDESLKKKKLKLYENLGYITKKGKK